MIELEHVSKTFPGSPSPAVEDLSLSIAEGEITVLVGPSGCGKTTTMKMINRLVEPTSGRITIAGDDVTKLQAFELRRRIGYVIQQIGLFPHKTVGENIATVPKLLGWDQTKIQTRVDELMDVVEIDVSMRDRYPSELSGGQRQRVGVARALAADPPVMLMDEPFGAVDPIVRNNLQDQFLALQQTLRKTIVFVTHDIDEAVRIGDRIAILNVGGVLEQLATPNELLRNPANPFVSDFLGTDRGIKRLSLIPISTVALDPGPIVAGTASASDIAAMMSRYGTDWVGVRTGTRVDGWVGLGDLDAGAVPPDFAARPFATRLRPNSSLKEALDAVVSSHTSVAAVFDEHENYLGMLSADTISSEIVQ